MLALDPRYLGKPSCFDGIQERVTSEWRFQLVAYLAAVDLLVWCRVITLLFDGAAFPSCFPIVLLFLCPLGGAGFHSFLLCGAAFLHLFGCRFPCYDLR